MRTDGGGETGSSERVAGACDAGDCTAPVAVRLHVPRDDDRLVCPAHARALARRDGVVAEPLEGAEGEWP